jgi:hypothetical protein
MPEPLGWVPLAYALRLRNHPPAEGEGQVIDGIETMREICDVPDALVLMAKLDHAPMPVISLLEQARMQLQGYLDKTDNSARWSRSG